METQEHLFFLPLAMGGWIINSFLALFFSWGRITESPFSHVIQIFGKAILKPLKSLESWA